jgi:hypothetical protein
MKPAQALLLLLRTALWFVDAYYSPVIFSEQLTVRELVKEFPPWDDVAASLQWNDVFDPLK